MALGILTGLAGALLWAVTAGGTQPYETYEEAVATDGPVAQFRFNDAPGSKTIEDFVGLYTATNNGIVLGGEGPFGGSKSGSFGGEAYASLPSSPLASAGAFTMEGWIDWTGGSSYEQPVFDFGSSTTNYMFLSPASSLSSHKMLFEIRTGTSSNVQVTAPKLAAKKWEYVAVTETGSGTLTLYLNGEQVGQTTGATLFPSSLGSVADDYLGKSQISSAPLFNGSLSNIAFYNKALPAERLKAHYDAGEYPVDTEAPTISGTTRDGSTLTAKTGGWTGLSPISYTYQWTLCNAAGEGCTSILSATEAKYTLGHEDVGQTVRVAVTATNSAGNSTATSAQTAVIAPLGPSNTVLPAISGAAEQGQLLSVSNGTWTGTPPLSYSYKWDTCNSAGEKCKTITGATSSSYRVLGSQIGDTLRAVVTAENAAGSKSADSEPTSVVTTGPPVNTELPTVSGEAKEGKTLSTSTGTWAGTEPFTYTYQWQHCTSTETSSCTDISGATSQTYTIQESDAGDWIRACVTAHNGYGETTACSVGVGPVGEGSGELKPNLAAVNCFENPEYEGTKRITECGYPTPENVGAEAPTPYGGTGKRCSELPASGNVTTSKAGEIIEDKDITGTIRIENENTTVKDVCINWTGTSSVLNMECEQAKNTKVEDSTIYGSTILKNSAGERGPVNFAINNDCFWQESGTNGLGKATKDVFFNCSSCVHGNWEVNESYVIANAGELAQAGGTPEPPGEGWHNEPIYINSNNKIVGHEPGGAFFGTKDTLFTPGASVAIVFGNTNGEDGGAPCSDKVRLTDSFIAGSGQMFEVCGYENTETATGEIKVEHDRIARCLGEEGYFETEQGTRCNKNKEWEERGIALAAGLGTTIKGEYIEAWGEKHGYFPKGQANEEGFNGCSPAASMCPQGSSSVWSGNFWDDNLEAVPENGG